MAGRPTTMVEVRQGDVLRERFCSTARPACSSSASQFDAAGATTRVVGFASLAIDPTTAAPPSPARTADQAPESVAPPACRRPPWPRPAWPTGTAASASTSGTARCRSSTATGSTTCRCSSSRARLDRRDLARDGGPVQVGRAAGWRYAWPGGQVVLWQAGDTVFTVVSDAPLDQVLAAARDLPVPVVRRPSAARPAAEHRPHRDPAPGCEPLSA